MRAGRSLLLAGLVAVLFAIGAGGALAHPLGLPATVRVAADSPDTVLVLWTAAADDVAALARSTGIDVAEGELLTGEQVEEFAASAGLRDAFADRVTISQDGAPCQLFDLDARDVLAIGVGARYRCPRAPVGALDLRVELLSQLDERYRTLGAIAGTEDIARTIFTAAEPERRIEVDPDSSVAEAMYVAAGVPDDPAREVSSFGGTVPFEDRFLAVIDGWSGLGAWTVGLLLALGVGALHGLAPGHGKAVAAAYLVGDRGRPRHAVVLGAAVSAMHTGSVLVLGTALYLASSRPDVVALTGWLRAMAGAVIAGLGAWLLVRQWRERGRAGRSPGAHDHAHGAHDHPHAHPRGSTVDRTRPTSDPERDPLSWSGLVALGAAGGLLPSPSAMLVLFTGLALGRLGFALALIAAFSIGLAATVTAVGLLALWGRDVLRERGAASGRVAAMLRHAPTVGAVVVVALGAWLLVTGVSAIT